MAAHAEVVHGDMRELLPLWATDGLLVDAVVTDPPYHLTSTVERFGKPGSAPAKFGKDGAFARASRGFMGKSWDGGDIAFQPETWRACYDLMKPGAHLVAFGGTRTMHRIVCAIEDAGFEIRDSLMWIYGSGMPKSHNVAKFIDKHFGVKGTVVPTGEPVKRMIPGADQNRDGSWIKDNGRTYQPGEYLPGTPEAEYWNGWGTSLKPAYEPIVLARKPFTGTIAKNVLAFGVGGINIDGCRIEGVKDIPASPRRASQHATYGDLSKDPGTGSGWNPNIGRWPANICHDGSDEVLEAFAGHGTSVTGARSNRSRSAQVENTKWLPNNHVSKEYTDSGTAARFFYSSKAGKADRAGSEHPTVKPLSLMRWLCRMVCPPGGMILDPFAGSGTTGQAARLEGFDSLLVERESDYITDIRRRLYETA